MVKRTFLTAVLCILLVFVTGCSGKTETGSGQPTGKEAGEPIKIGFIQSTTGPLEMLAKWTTQGFD